VNATFLPEFPMLIPRQKTPDLSLPLVGGGTFALSQETSPRGTVVTFYRGLHCPICASYLKELERLTPEFAKRGVGTIAISSDGAERAAAMAEKIGATELRFAHDLPLGQARDWGLYISTSRGKTSIGIEEPALFSEPGLFLVNHDLSLYYMSVQTMPFVRPHFSELLAALDFALDKNYPARGEYTGSV
jgi:peroxiredoxin